MSGKFLIALTLTCALCAVATAQDAKSVLAATIKNMGDLKSAQYSGTGAQFNLGQSVSPDTPWPRTELRSFTRTVNYEKPATRNEAAGPQGPLATQFFAGDKAWGQTGNNVTAAAAAVATERQLQIWLTPHGFFERRASQPGDREEERQGHARELHRAGQVPCGRYNLRRQSG